MPPLRRNPRQVSSRLEQLEFGVPYPQWRGTRTTDQTIPAGDDAPILWDIWENSDPTLFTEVLSGGEVQSIEINRRGVFAITAGYQWDTFPAATTYWLTIHSSYFAPSVLYQESIGLASLGNEISFGYVRGFAQFRLVPLTTVAEIQVDAGNGDASPRDVAQGSAHLEIYYLGALSIDTEQYI